MINPKLLSFLTVLVTLIKPSHDEPNAIFFLNVLRVVFHL